MLSRPASLAPPSHLAGPFVRPYLAVRASPTLLRRTAALMLVFAFSGSALGAEPNPGVTHSPGPPSVTSAQAPASAETEPSSADASTAESSPEERFSLHYQTTVATQWHPSFRASYSGANGLRPKAESATSVVLDLFTGARLWRGAEVYLQPELGGGRGLSSTLTREVSAGVNYQPILHPSYNSDRGPVHVFTGRVHVAF